MVRAVKSPLSHHFSTVAPRYNGLRITDREPIDFMARSLEGRSHVTAAEVGCGTGRYMMELMRRLDRRIFVHFIDRSVGMLQQLRLEANSLGISEFNILQAPAERLPLPDRSLDCMLAFNSIHHFDVTRFLREAGRTLRPGGLLFIYTRFRDQNERSIWGQCFPGFATRETRLYDEGQISRTVGSYDCLAVRDLTRFSFRRAATLDCLVQRALNKHYSTFCLYKPDELASAIEGFKTSLKKRFGPCEVFEWVDENAMVTAERL